MSLDTNKHPPPAVSSKDSPHYSKYRQPFPPWKQAQNTHQMSQKTIILSSFQQYQNTHHNAFKKPFTDACLSKLTSTHNQADRWWYSSDHRDFHGFWSDSSASCDFLGPLVQHFLDWLPAQIWHQPWPSPSIVFSFLFLCWPWPYSSFFLIMPKWKKM